MTAHNLCFIGNIELWHMQSGGCWSMMEMEVIKRPCNPHCLFRRCICSGGQHWTSPHGSTCILHSLCMWTDMWFLPPSGWYWFDRSSWITRSTGKGRIDLYLCCLDTLQVRDWRQFINRTLHRLTTGTCSGFVFGRFSLQLQLSRCYNRRGCVGFLLWNDTTEGLSQHCRHSSLFVIDRGSPALVESQGSQESRWATAFNSLSPVIPCIIPVAADWHTGCLFFPWQGERGPLGETGFPGPEGPQGVAVRMPHVVS